MELDTLCKIQKEILEFWSLCCLLIKPHFTSHTINYGLLRKLLPHKKVFISYYLFTLLHCFFSEVLMRNGCDLNNVHVFLWEAALHCCQQLVLVTLILSVTLQEKDENTKCC